MSNSLPLNTLDSSVNEFVRNALGVTTINVVENVQSLWGGQGQILRLQTDSKIHPCSILKHVCLNAQADHPRGWNTSASFQRKATSYDVERCWYQSYAAQCNTKCKVPATLGTLSNNGESLILLEDLAFEYPLTFDSLKLENAKVCLEWLAHFHARFLSDAGNGLWPEGCYWHLATRADEYAAMTDGPLKQSADALAAKLSGAQFQTLVHGDAKVTNFCFSQSLDAVAAVDFQYVGKGCGIRHVAYFLGSCLTEHECAKNESALLNIYFDAFRTSLNNKLSTDHIYEIEHEWRGLYGVAWTDFYRFLSGWMPTHKKINAYTLSLCEQTLSDL